MKVGLTLFAQNLDDWDRFHREAAGEAPALPDGDVLAADFAIGALAEPLGFDSLWTVEHHCSPYSMTPDPMQYLAYFAGQTTRIDMGTMVVVLPWHDPLHVAEKIALLDHMLAGRRFIVGVGRGSSPIEFHGMRGDMARSREKFAEALHLIRLALQEEWFEFHGDFYDVPRTTIRPRPRTPDLTQGWLCAAGSPTTLPIVAGEGMRLLISGGRSWDSYVDDIATYNAERGRLGLPPERPVLLLQVYCDADADRARAGALQHIGDFQLSAIAHYGLDQPTQLQGVRGMEYHLQRAQRASAASEQQVREAAIREQVWGTPEMCVERVAEIQRLTGADQIITVFNYSRIDRETGERNVRLFAEAALPHIQALSPAPPPGS